jgi:hypothetical protein
MAEQQFDIVYVKSPLWRTLYATGAAIGTTTGPTGQQFIVRFTNEWADIEKETFLAEIDHTKGTYQVKSEAKLLLGPLTKLEEVAVILPPDALGNIVIALLTQFANYSPAVQQKVRTAAENLPKI